MKFEPRSFNIPKLKGISETNIREHLKLYEGYVNNANLVLQRLAEYEQDLEENLYMIGELGRRFSFEFNGMRNHEVYFSSLEDGPKKLTDAGILKEALTKEWGSFENWLSSLKTLALTRGIGWAALYYDRVSGRLINSWIDEQHMGQLQNSAMIFGIDMWEHAYVFDYQPSGKKKYIEDFISNVNWESVERNFDDAAKTKRP